MKANIATQAIGIEATAKGATLTDYLKYMLGELTSRIDELEKAVQSASTQSAIDSINTKITELDGRQHLKQVLTINEASEYMGISKSMLYKLCASKEIPYYKPTGRFNYFDRTELDEWIKASKIKSNKEIEIEANAQANRYLTQRRNSFNRRPVAAHR